MLQKDSVSPVRAPLLGSVSKACMCPHDGRFHQICSDFKIRRLDAHSFIEKTAWDKAGLLKLNVRVSFQCIVPHGSHRITPTLKALTSGCSVRTFVSQPVLCCQQWEGVGLVHFYSTSCYSRLNTEPGQCLWKETRQGDWQLAKPAH